MDRKAADSGLNSASLVSETNTTISSSEGEDSDEQNSDVDEDSLGSTQSPDIINCNNNNNIFSPSDSLISNKSCCNCSCHLNGLSESISEKKQSKQVSDSSAQTLSTGDIVITKVYFQDNQQ